MLLDGQTPLAKPLSDRSDEVTALQRMLLEVLPFLIGRLAYLVQNVRMYRHLADVVEQRRPSKAVSILWRKTKLVGDEIGECADALRVTSSAPVVPTQRGRKRENLDGGRVWFAQLHVIVLSVVNPTTQVSGRTCLSNNCKPRRRLVREQHRHVQ
jgi:hypothetical protein